MRKVIYIASPYTKGDNFVNVQRSIEAANKLLDMGYIAISPLVNSVFYHMQRERSWSEWMEIDYQLVNMCDCLVRLPGDSTGADKEVIYALSHNKPVYIGMEQVPNA